MGAVGQKKELHISFRPCRDYLIALLPLMIMAVYLYGLRPVFIFLIAVATAFVCDVLVGAVLKKGYDVSDISS